MSVFLAAFGYVLVITGIIIFFFTVLGLFRFDHVMNRMHAAAMGDGLAFGVVMIGLACLNGIQMSSLKFLCAGLLLFFASPVCSHLVARYEFEADEELRKKCEVEDRCRS